MNQTKRNVQIDSTGSHSLRLEIKRVRVRTTVKAGDTPTVDSCNIRNQTSCHCLAAEASGSS
jgi:hypothetical protein